MYRDVREIIGPKWSLEILALVENEGPIRFTAIEKELETSSDIVSKRLAKLLENGLIERHAKTARNVSYSIEPHGKQVLSIVNQLQDILSNHSSKSSK